MRMICCKVPVQTNCILIFCQRLHWRSFCFTLVVIGCLVARSGNNSVADNQPHHGHCRSGVVLCHELEQNMFARIESSLMGSTQRIDAPKTNDS